MSASAGISLSRRCIPDLSPSLVPLDGVHVFWLALGNGLEPGAFARLLAADELCRARQFSFEQDRNRYLVAHGVLRMVLAAHLGCPAESLQFRTGRNGKPALTRGSVEFNISHSAELAAIVIAGAGRDVGIDVERVRPLPDMAGLLRHFATDAEAAALSALPADRQEAEFYRLWTRKEAALKATGDGLLRAANGFAAGAGEARVRLGAGPALWIRSLGAAVGYAAALAVAGPRPRIRITSLVLSGERPHRDPLHSETCVAR